MHFHLPKPMHGWREFAGEVGIIVIGVLIALGAEQVVETLRWHREADEAIASIKNEVTDHYFSASEALRATPCIDRQLEILEAGLLQPGTYVPPPMYSDNTIEYVFRTPDRIWSDSVWRSIQAQGIVSHLPSDTRLGLGAYYSQVVGSRDNNVAIKLLDYRLRVLARPLSLDPTTKGHLVEEIEETRGRVKEQAIYASQMMRHAEALRLHPTRQTLDQMLARSGTLKFCRDHRLPMGNDQVVL